MTHNFGLASGAQAAATCGLSDLALFSRRCGSPPPRGGVQNCTASRKGCPFEGHPAPENTKTRAEHKNRKTTTARHSVIDTLSPLVQSPPPSARTHYCGMMLETTCWVRTPSSSMNQGGLGQLAPLKGYEQLCSSYRFGLLPSRPPPLLDLSCSRRDVPRVIGDVAPTTPC